MGEGSSGVSGGGQRKARNCWNQTAIGDLSETQAWLPLLEHRWWKFCGTAQERDREIMGLSSFQFRVTFREKA